MQLVYPLTETRLTRYYDLGAPLQPYIRCAFTRADKQGLPTLYTEPNVLFADEFVQFSVVDSATPNPNLGEVDLCGVAGTWIWELQTGADGINFTTVYRELVKALPRTATYVHG